MRRTTRLVWAALVVVTAVLAGCGGGEAGTNTPKSGKAIADLKSTDARVRQAAAMALTSLRDPLAVEPLIEALKGDQEAKVRRLAAMALRTQRDARAVEPLIAALKDEESGVRRAAADALRALNDTQAVEALTDVSKNDRDRAVRQAAERALKELKGEGEE